MSRSRREEERALSGDERDFVAQSHQPAVKALSDEALSDLLKRLRERRDRAGDIAKRQRREMRGKAAPGGASPSSGDNGTRLKAAALAAAVKRTNNELRRRRSASARGDLVANAHRALALKRAGEGARHHPSSRTAGEGMRSNPNTDIAPSGALNEEGHRPVLERSRKVR